MNTKATTTTTTKAADGTQSVFEVETYTAPTCWASYLINGDFSGLEDDDISQADAFVDEVGAGAPVDCEDAGFIHRPDFGELAGDCQAYSFLRHK